MPPPDERTEQTETNELLSFHELVLGGNDTVTTVTRGEKRSTI